MCNLNLKIIKTRIVYIVQRRIKFSIVRKTVIDQADADKKPQIKLFYPTKFLFQLYG